MKIVAFYRRASGAPKEARYLLGHACKCSITLGGWWRFVSLIKGRPSTRWAHRTMEDCLPKWLDYPDGCESEVVQE